MNERQLKILELLNLRGSVEVSGLVTEMGVSAVTVRKDLAALEENGLLRRQHGMALRPSPNDMAFRMTQDYDLKKRVARRAAEMVDMGETVMIESGSTCAMLAAELAQRRKDVTVITNSAFIAGSIRRFPGARAILLGGSYDPDSQTLSGPLVSLCAAQFNVDKFFIGTDGYEPAGGFYNVDLQRAEAVRAMAERARKRFILTDGGKFNRKSVVSLLPAREIYAVVTDRVPEDCRRSLEEAGVRIVLAEDAKENG